MRQMAIIFAWGAGCAGAPDPTDTGCEPENNVYETAGCACDEDADCTCQQFTGAAFEDRATRSACDGGACISCLYR
jgi:hypothetical protein